MKQEEIFIIGDCHGEYDKLISLLNKIPFSKNEQVFFCGDLIDRGPDSAKIVKLIRENNFNVTIGNHESFAIENKGSIFNSAMYGETYNFWGHPRNGGVQTFDSYLKEYGKMGYEKLLEDVEYFKTLPNYIIVEVENFNKKILITHGSFLDHIDSYLKAKKELFEIYPNDTLDSLLDKNDLNSDTNELLATVLSKNELMKINRILPKMENDKYFNVFGHTIVNKNSIQFIDYDKFVQNNVYLNKEIGFCAIDTGAFVSKESKLSAISFPSLKIYNN